MLESSYIFKGNNFMRLSLLFIIFLLTLQSCKKDPVGGEVDEELRPYFELFKEEGEKRGVDIDYIANPINGSILDIVTTGIAGQCFNDLNPPRIVIEEALWENADESEKAFIVFHELGHCYLKQQHRDQQNSDGSCVSLMHSNPGVCRSEFAERPDDYYDELFSE
ncbi:MAG: hypothetical protein AAGK97_15515 [Bacteroidota bacterium]